MKKKYSAVLLLILMTTCTQKNKKAGAQTSPSINDSIPAIRKTVNKKPVATYFVPMGDARLDRKFGVAIYETPETFKYRLAMQYDAMLQDDTLTVPDFDVWPAVEIKPGPDKLSCIIGFLDEEKNFREYKLLSAKNSELKLTRLKSYGVETYVK